MKQIDIRPCVCCGEGVMHDWSITFYEVTMGYYVVDVQAARRQVGLEIMMGGSAVLAEVMGPDEDIARQVGDAPLVLVCVTCAARVTLAELSERAHSAATKESEEP